jgi:hypothetical protein
LLANLLSNQLGIDYVQKNQKLAKDIINIILNLLKEKISSSVLYNLLMSLSHLAKYKDRFAAPLDESKFSDKVTDFHEFYSQLNPNGNTYYY